jgi:hypothetical protein
MQPSRVLLIALLLFIGMTVTCKDGWDRWIYGAFTVVTMAALIHYRDVPSLAGWRF